MVLRNSRNMHGQDTNVEIDIEWKRAISWLCRVMFDMCGAARAAHGMKIMNCSSCAAEFSSFFFLFICLPRLLFVVDVVSSSFYFVDSLAPMVYVCESLRVNDDIVERSGVQ